MFDASYDRLNLLELLAALQLNPGEGSPRCPSCERPGLVFVNHGAQCTCPTCGLDDDIVGLAARTWSYDIDRTVQTFVSRGFIPAPLAADLELYAKARAPYDRMAEVFAAAQANIGSVRYGALNFLLKKLLVENFTEGHDLAKIAGVCGLLNAAEAVGLPFSTDFRKFAKGSYALVFPLYARRRALSGFFCINKNGDDEVFLHDETDTAHFLGLRTVPVRGVDHVIVAESVRDVAGVIANLALNGLRAVPVIAPVVLTAHQVPCAIPDIGSAATVMWSNDLNTAFRWANEQPNATIATERRGLPAFNAMGMGPYLADVVATAQPPLRAVALRLADLTPGAAALVYRQLALDPAERNCLLAEAPMMIKPFITALVLGESTTPRGSFDGREIRATDHGWEFSDDGSKISNFTLSLQETWSAPDGTMVRGVVTAGGRMLSFEVEFEEIQNRASKWLTDFLSKHQAPVPYLYGMKFRRALFDIAMSFGHPQPRASGDAVHWDGNTLVLPGFSISPTGEYKQRADTEANTSSSCSILRPPAGLDNFEIVDASAMWPILLHVAINATAQLHGYKSPGLVIAGTGRIGWINALRSRLGLTLKSTAFAAGTCAFEAEAVFPPIVSLDSEATYREWIADPRHNAIIATPRVGLRVLRYLGWNYISVENEPSAAAIAAIPQVINLIRAAIQLGGTALTLPGENPYYALARVTTAMYREVHSTLIMNAAVHLGAMYRYSKTPDTETLRLVGSVYDLQLVGDLRVNIDNIDGSVLVNWSNYCACMESHGVKPVNRDKALSILRAGKAGGINAPADHVKISTYSWTRAEQWSGAML